MKRFLFIPIATAVLISGCSKPAASTENAPQPESSAPSAVKAPEPTPAPKPVVSTAPDKTPEKSTAEPAAPAKVLAPEGTLFAVERISVTTDDGVFSVPGGTKLKIVKKTSDGYVVSDGRKEFPVEARQVTNEVQAATAAAQTHQAEHAANTASNQAQVAAQMEIARARQAELAANAAASEKDRQLRVYQAKSMALTAEMADLTSKIEQANVEARRSWEATHLYGRVSTRSVDPTLNSGYQRRLAVAQEEKRQVDAAIFQLQVAH